MACNWELYELRVMIFLRGEKNGAGNFSGEILWEFFNVSVDLNSVGISGFQGNNNYCNFKTVFGELVKLKMLPFGFPKERIKSDRLNFGNLQVAEQKGIQHRAAKLYVHRRDQSDTTSQHTGAGVLLERIKVDMTTTTPSFYAILSGDSANLVN